MKRVADIQQNSRESAVVFAKLVLPHADKVGADVEDMKERMARWVTIVENYERDIRDAWNNTSIEVRERARLVKTMRIARKQLMDEIFGSE